MSTPISDTTTNASIKVNPGRLSAAPRLLVRRSLVTPAPRSDYGPLLDYDKRQIHSGL